MAPIKFEDKLKDKLENRTLSPSPDAWSALADRLDKEEKKNNNSRFWWLGIAASIIGIVLVTTQFYKSDIDEKELPVVVNSQSLPESHSESTKKSVVVEDDVTETKLETVIEIPKDEVVSSAINKSNEVQKSISNKSIITQPEIANDIVVSVEASKQNLNDNVDVNALSNEELKIIEVVDVIKQLKAEDSSVTDKEIDSLLKQAQREILKDRIFDESTKTVNADALLQDVEIELDQSFRAKVFEALRENFSSVKTAVAERNN